MNNSCRLVSLLLAFTSLVPASAYTVQAREIEGKPKVFDLLNLEISNVDSLVGYFRSRQADSRRAVVLPGFKPTSTISLQEQKWADEGMEHKFFVHSGYQPSYFYGDDIDWQLWPVKDNELRWQLHRMKWWVPMGKAYRNSGDEKYAKEWMYQYRDWIAKNPLGNYISTAGRKMISADNMYWAWRPLETSHRIEDQIRQFMLFLPSPLFDGEFISEFLVNYHRHCEHIMAHFSAQGNHLLFQAQRLLYASVFFPEFKDAKRWRETALKILNDEISRQVYKDGVHYELDPHYHVASINIFYAALQICHTNGLQGVFPDTYAETVHNMIRLVYNWSFPDLTSPQFSDFHGQYNMPPLYSAWRDVFSDDGMIARLATDGREGSVPDYLSKAFEIGGFYCLRNAWDKEATVMIVKAGPKGEWHNQPDNGTFEYWRKGRNFFPDSGAYVYGGDSSVNEQRAWFRRTSVHNTLTLDGKNIIFEDSRLCYWEETDSSTVMSVLNCPYPGLSHLRTVNFHNDGRVSITDEAYGPAQGEVAIHFNLLPCSPQEQLDKMSVSTAFPDGNNIRLQLSAPEGSVMERQEGRVSYAYRQFVERPAYRVKAYKKSGETLVFRTEIIPAKAL